MPRTINITKAKNITKDRLRRERKPLLEEQDILFMKAQETNADTTAIVAEKKRLRDIIASEEDKFWKVISNNTKFSENLINLDVRLLKNYYKSIGYYDVEVSSSSAEVDTKGNVNINYTINAGDRYIIEKISISRHLKESMDLI